MSKEDLRLMMVLNLVFLEGRFNGSTLALMGRNSVLEEVREFSIIGGSVVFRGARGCPGLSNQIVQLLILQPISFKFVWQLHLFHAGKRSYVIRMW